MVKEGEKTCPFCGGKLQKRGKVKRTLRLGDGETMMISVKRYSCKTCGRWLRELPSDCLPYKQYPKTIIDRFNSGKLSDESTGYENYPVGITKSRWKKGRK